MEKPPIHRDVEEGLEDYENRTADSLLPELTEFQKELQEMIITNLVELVTEAEEIIPGLKNLNIKELPNLNLGGYDVEGHWHFGDPLYESFSRKLYTRVMTGEEDSSKAHLLSSIYELVYELEHIRDEAFPVTGRTAEESIQRIKRWLSVFRK